MRGQEGQTPNECLKRERREEARIARCPTTISILEVPTQCHRLGKGSSVAKWEGWGQRGWCCSHDAEGRTQASQSQTRGKVGGGFPAAPHRSLDQQGGKRP